ncbi:MAG: hypothetical protein AB7S26_18745 [Sandaracinaceae bacterium]
MTAALAERDAEVLSVEGERFTWLDILTRSTAAERELMMRRGTPPKFEDLVGWEWGGGNCRVSFRLLGIRKFVKGFYEGPARDKGPEPFIQGYNIPAAGNGDSEPHVLELKGGKPTRFGFYRVHTVVPGARDDYYPNSVLLDYGLGGNGIFGPPLRDYLVQVYPDNKDLLLGKAYLNILGLRIPTNYFVLKRLHEHDFHG